jgi:hypothetical protein
MTMTPVTGKDNNNHTEHHSTHPHTYEQLLIGWIVGATDDNGEKMGKWAQEKSMSPGP